MRPSDFVPPFGTEFNGFLFALMAEERNDMRHSVISALARLDIHPWKEGAKLSGLPRKTATERFAVLLARLPPSMQLDSGAAARLFVARARLPAPQTAPDFKRDWPPAETDRLDRR